MDSPLEKAKNIEPRKTKNNDQGELLMKIDSLSVKNFKSIKEVHLEDINHAMILVGKNSTGKTVILEAIRVFTGEYELTDRDFQDPTLPISISATLSVDEEDLEQLHCMGAVSKYKNFDLWLKDFKKKLPSFHEDGSIYLECNMKKGKALVYSDGINKKNKYIKQIFPKVYFVDYKRNLETIQTDILSFLGNAEEHPCDGKAESINHIYKKQIEELTVNELMTVLEYKLAHTNLNAFSEKITEKFEKYSSSNSSIQYSMDINMDELIKIQTMVQNRITKVVEPIETISPGLRNIYFLAVLEAYIEEGDYHLPCLIMIEDPEMFLHPELQKVASEILYRLSKKNQVIFSTHSPNMIFNFSSKQINQVKLDENNHTVVLGDVDIDNILDDLGYSANDLMNVNFVFIVEGKQDGARLPMLLEKYYSEIYTEDNTLQRVAIIPVNSCTNIKTYANLKYINKLYLKDQFLMIRDSDGKDPAMLKRQLYRYYKEREVHDKYNLPRIRERNVLILKYYSFENYFLDPPTMVKIGLIKNEEEFYNILYKKYKDYLYKIGSVKRMIRETGIRINSKHDLKSNIEMIKIYVRGHNLFEIFYGRYKGGRKDYLLKEYIDVANREVFADILDAIDSFVYFENRRKDVDE